MTDGQNQRLGAYVETSAAGERVRAYVPGPLPPQPALELGRFMRVYERAIAAVGRLVAARRCHLAIGTQQPSPPACD